MIRWVLFEVVYFYVSVIRAIFTERLIFTGIFLILVSPYLLAIHIVMRFVPKEHEEKVLPFIYTMQ